MSELLQTNVHKMLAPTMSYIEASTYNEQGAKTAPKQLREHVSKTCRHITSFESICRPHHTRLDKVNSSLSGQIMLSNVP